MAIGFADAFWSSDYANGVHSLFAKLQQGCVENSEVLSLARLRAECEDAYGLRLEDLAKGVGKNGGFARDEGASLKKAYEGMRKEMEASGRSHRKVSQNLTLMVTQPFSRWCADHEHRINSSQGALSKILKTYDRQLNAVKKSRNFYFNKCRQLEEIEEESKYAFPTPPKKNSQSTEPSPPRTESRRSTTTEIDAAEMEPFEIGDALYSPEDLAKILKAVLDQVPRKEVKVPILGTYQDVSTGSDIVLCVEKVFSVTAIAQCERIGQDLIQNGFLRMIGSVGNQFANSSVLNYQWRKQAFSLAFGAESEVTAATKRNETLAVNAANVPYVGDYLSGAISSLNNAHSDESPAQRLKREAAESDNRYKTDVLLLDETRCLLEESMMEHFKFIERCELDRLKATKSVLLDIAASLSNIIPSIQSSVDNMLLYQETVQPEGDLRYMIESNRTGTFMPKVTTYENYLNASTDQTFGGDLEHRAKQDHKRVPHFVSTVLQFLDEQYPLLDNDKARRDVWLMDVPLTATHHLRVKINKGMHLELLAQYETPIIASALKLYLLELPDSLISSNVYDIFKALYASHGNDVDDRKRLAAIQNTLVQLRVSHVATLDALLTHLTRLIALVAGNNESFAQQIANNLGPCILRPRQESSLTQHDRHASRLIMDLFRHKDKIFKELKKHAAGRIRTTSSDESNRRANAQERHRAVSAAMSRERTSSPVRRPPSKEYAAAQAQTGMPSPQLDTTSASYFYSDLSPSGQDKTSLGPQQDEDLPLDADLITSKPPSLSRRGYVRKGSNTTRHSRTGSALEQDSGDISQEAGLLPVIPAEQNTDAVATVVNTVDEFSACTMEVRELL